MERRRIEFSLEHLDKRQAELYLIKIIIGMIIKKKGDCTTVAWISFYMMPD